MRWDHVLVKGHESGGTSFVAFVRARKTQRATSPGGISRVRALLLGWSDRVLTVLLKFLVRRSD